jgi:hypothetical protein
VVAAVTMGAGATSVMQPWLCYRGPWHLRLLLLLLLLPLPGAPSMAASPPGTRPWVAAADCRQLATVPTLTVTCGCCHSCHESLLLLLGGGLLLPADPRPGRAVLQLATMVVSTSACGCAARAFRAPQDKWWRTCRRQLSGASTFRAMSIRFALT